MKSIWFFVEIDDNGNSVDKNHFLDICNKNEIAVATKEYMKLLEKKADNVIEIPDEMIEEFECGLEKKSSRQIMMKIKKSENAKKWFAGLINNLKTKVDGIIIKDEYICILEAANQEGLAAYVQKNRMECTEMYEDVMEKMQDKINDLEKENQQYQNTIDTLNANLQSSFDYTHNLQIHATELDNKLQKYKEFYEQNKEKVEYADKEVKRYLDLYKQTWKELDEKKIEVLELQQKLKKNEKK